MGGPALNQNLKMFILLLLMLISCSTAASPEKTECTEGLKGRASLKFSECREPLIPLKQCYKLYPDTLGSTSPWLELFLKEYGNNSHEADYCHTRKNMTSCEHLTYLTQVCGAHYDDCHTNEEKKEIMRMWIKQFVKGTNEIYWEFAFSDNNKEIINGDCNHNLNEYFSKEEVAEITELVNTGPNIFEDCSWELNDEKNIKICSSKESNLTQKFGILVNKDGTTKYDKNVYEITLPSHWKYCSWKLKNAVDEMGIYRALPHLAHCDGKCNTNDGDDQEWQSTFHTYMDLETGTDHDFYNPLDFGENPLFSCILQAGSPSRFSESSEDLDKIKMQLCKPFKTIIENCSIPMSECIENIAVKEIVMADFLKNMVAAVKQEMEIVESIHPGSMADFTYDDCMIFGGDVAGANYHYPTLAQFMIIPAIVSYIIIS